MTITKSSTVNRTNTWEKLTTLVTNLLSDSVGEDERTNVLKAWANKRNEVTKLFGGKPKKDPLAPKKAKSGYMIFCEATRESFLKSKGKGLAPKEVMKALGEQWNELSDVKKDKYKKLAGKDKERYEAAMVNYTPSEEFAVPVKAKRTGPPRPASGYIRFSNEMRPVVKRDLPDLSSKEVPAELGRRWKALSDDEKAPYNNAYKADMARLNASSEAAASVSAPAPKKGSRSKGASTKPAFESAVESVAESAVESVVEAATPSKGKGRGKKTTATEAPVASSRETSKKSRNASETSNTSEVPVEKKGGKRPKAQAAEAKQAKPEKKTQSRGYKVFSNEVKEENSSWSSSKLSSEVDKRWAALSESEHELYEREAEAQSSGEVVEE